MPLKRKPLLILDRDGVINKDSSDYIKSLADWHPIPGSYEAIAKLTQAGFPIVVASNQSALSRGLTTLAEVTAIHTHLNQALAAMQGRILAFAICPHLPEHHCNCRKPKPGLLTQLARDFSYNADECIIIGDSARDLQAAASFGAKAFWVQTGNTIDSTQFPTVITAPDLHAVAMHLLKE